jgi:tetratricopeptide (TPR) repeat protein
MRTRISAPMLAAVLALLVAGVGCGMVDLIKARAAFQDGNKAYKAEDYRGAIEEYEKAVALKPDFAEAHVYLASAHQALYLPAREDDAENRMHLDKAIEHYEKSLEVNEGGTANLEAARLTALGALISIYSDPPVQDFEKALHYAEELVKDNPDDVKNKYAMANLYEEFGRVDEAEATYLQVVRDHPEDSKACGALAAFYNKPLWDKDANAWKDEEQGPRQARFEDAIQTMERCAELDPDDPNGFYKVATFHWDKAYRDPTLTDEQKNEYADLGIEAVEKALAIDPTFWEAIISKGLLYRVKAQVAPNRSERKKYLEQAQILQKQALELRQEQEEATAIPQEEAMAEVTE